ncbi:MAG: caspase family protein [Saprospiraceae bacterium]|nr:caspase family protein [Saprospiraceae bacterium]
MRISLIFPMLFPAMLLGQNIKQVWKKDFTPHGTAAFQSAIEATNGYLISVGATQVKSQGGTDGYLRITDPGTGQTRFEKLYGNKEDNVFYSVAQTYNGLFLLAGATTTGGKNGKDAWVVLVNERGEKIKELRFGGAGDDVCRFILTSPDGSALLAGFKNDKKNGDIWLAKMEGDTLAWETEIGKNQFAGISGIVKASDGGFVLCGNTDNKAEPGTGYVYVTKVNAQGKPVAGWPKFLGEKGWSEAGSLIATHEGGFVIAGKTNAKGAGGFDAWLVKLSRDGFRQWDKVYGGKGEDMAYALIQNELGYLLAGASDSHRSGARTMESFLVQTTTGGDLIWEEFQGGDKDDAVSSVLYLHDGGYALGGYSGNDTWIQRITPNQSDLLAVAGLRNLEKIETSDVKIRTADGTVKPNEQTALTFLITNNSDTDLPDLRVIADKRTENDHLDAWNANYFGTLRKGESIMASVPLAGKAELTDGACELSLTIASGEKKLKSINQNITLHELRPAMLGIKGFQFVTSATSDAVTLKVEIVNNGDESSGPAEVRFSAPPGISVSGERTKVLGVVGPHKSREVSLTFTKGQFKEAVANIICVVTDGGAEAIRKTMEWQAGGKVLAGGPIMIWTDPVPQNNSKNKKVRTNDNKFGFKMAVADSKPLDTKNFKVKLNGVEMEGSKFNEEELSPPKIENERYTYIYQNEILLEQGVNYVQVVIDGEVSEILEVEFSPDRANLHLMVIGPKHDDLKFTEKDAADIAAAFKNQGGENKLYNQVITYALHTPEKTSETAIKQAFYDLAYLWDDKQIGENDVLLIFISSHGKITNNRFKILQTGYDPKYQDITIDFKDIVLDILAPINCKKLIFLDACHSGGAKDGFGAVSKAVVDLANTQPGISTLSSCSSTEKSYEDPSWGNGAFTKALLEGFGDVECTDINGRFSADNDRDGIVRLGELYGFLRRRVPELVKQTIPNAPTTQTPFMPESQLDVNLPIYFIEKK